MLCGDLNGKEIQKRGNICIHVVHSLCRIVETNMEKAMATHSSVLAWRITGTTEPGGLSSMGSHRVGHD